MNKLRKQAKTFAAAQRVDDHLWLFECPYELFRPLGCALAAHSIGSGGVPGISFRLGEKPWPTAGVLPVEPFVAAYNTMLAMGAFPAESPFYFPSMRMNQRLYAKLEPAPQVQIERADVIFWGVFSLEIE